MGKMYSVAIWRPVTISFTVALSEGINPFRDVEIKAVFTAPSGKTVHREAYWDGTACTRKDGEVEQIYRIAFAPTETGTWTGEINGVRGTAIRDFVEVEAIVPGEAERLALYRHGFPRVSPEKDHFIYADGTPFFWLGDTHWEFAHGERWDESNHPQMDSMFRGMVDKRKSQGYSVYQTNLRADPGFFRGDTFYFADSANGTVPNLAFYQGELDLKMAYIADAGIVNALGFGWGGSIVGHETYWRDLARYIAARYGALPIIWTIAGELAGYEDTREAELALIDGWREIALYVNALDGQSLQTVHYDCKRPFPDYYYDEDWYDFTLNQAGHGDHPISAWMFKDYRRAHPDKPFVEGESMYEFCSTMEENGIRLCEPKMVRKVAYTAIQCGACGYTYGAQGIWDNIWEKFEADPGNLMQAFNQYGIPWYVAIDGEGGAQMGYMKAFYEKEGFQNLKPLVVKVLSRFGEDVDGSLRSPLATANADRSHIVVYYNEHTRGGCIVDVPEDGDYEMTWYDPRTGEYVPAGNGAGNGVVPGTGNCVVPGDSGRILTSADGRLELPGRSKLGDWVMVVRKMRG